MFIYGVYFSRHSDADYRPGGQADLIGSGAVLVSILTGDMSIVGPRPALFNQDDLIALRTANGVHLLTPGLTGWAQINGRDELPIPVKVEFDEWYLHNRSFFLDAKIIVQTFVKVLRKEGVTH
jgi:O-antigen biosynthesis protein WbqP